MGFRPGSHQPASNSVYSHPMVAAKSEKRLNNCAVAGPFGYDHQAHDARPGRIQDVSAMREGAERSVMSVDVAMSPASFAKIMTRQGIVHGNANRGSGPN